ncbi:helix-turn-helix domain-containing protein [Nesterenkonia lacusekhoensis]|uniref:helix-turn-helix domain-containing protein n=1 Tax=Nesterenkonia lacusekhoensis TaxID=150832 RepID=UPI003386475B
MSEQSRKLSAGGRRKRLAPSVKYEVFTLVLTNQATQAEIAAKYGVDRSTIKKICTTAKQGAIEALAGSSRAAGSGTSSDHRPGHRGGAGGSDSPEAGPPRLTAGHGVCL